MRERGFSLPLVLVVVPVVVFIIVVVASFLLKPKPATQPQPNLVTQKTPTTQATSPSQTDKTADWKVYRNEKFSFEFKYPNDWTIKEYSHPILKLVLELKDPKSNLNFTITIMEGFVGGYCQAHPQETERCDPIQVDGKSTFIEQDFGAVIVNLKISDKYGLRVAAGLIDPGDTEKRIFFKKFLLTFKFLD